MTPSKAFLSANKTPKLTPPSFEFDEAVENRLKDIQRRSPKCTVKTCPLWHFRPYQKSGGGE
jgi:hypothetical protein